MTGPHPARGPHPLRGRGAALAVAAVLGACAQGPEHPPEAHEPGPRIQALLQDGREDVLVSPDGDTVLLRNELTDFYRDRDFRPAWTSPEGFLPRGDTLIQELHAAGEEGLDPEAYHREHVHRLIDEVQREHEEGQPVGDLLGELDLLLAEAFLRYTTDLRRGTIDPAEDGLTWRIPREDGTDPAFLNSVLAGDFATALDSLRPASPYYGRLREALARYRRIAEEGGWPRVPGGETLDEGMTGPRVAILRERLRMEGDPREAQLAMATSRPDSFDANLFRALELFQERHGITSDSRLGPETLEALNVSVEERIRTLRLNLDRWRWLPRDLGERHLIVNVAGFEMVVVEGQEAVMTMDVVVGQEGWQTPIFRDTMEYVVVNPYWNVPRSIADEEIVPAAESDPGYLARNRYEVVTQDGNVVDARAVDLRDERYRIRQRPGPGNALGNVKFLFPNDHDIYLHDTPAQELFSRAGRAFSHGCIRVAEPERLARYLLRSSTDRPPEDYDRLRQESGEQWVAMERPLPVYVLYFTAWAGANGRVRFYRDVYGRDAQVDEVARHKLPEERLPTRAGPRRPDSASTVTDVLPGRPPS